MEGCLVVLALAIPAACIAVAVLAFMAFRRTGKLLAQVRRVEGELDRLGDLDRRLAVLEQGRPGAPASAPEAAAAELAAPEPLAEERGAEEPITAEAAAPGTPPPGPRAPGIAAPQEAAPWTAEGAPTPPSSTPRPPAPATMPPPRPPSPGPASTSTPPTSPPPAPAGGGIDWESWLGVRGAALLAGVVLALAGLFFFKYSIEQGLISPPVRVILGTLAGLACLAASEVIRKRRYTATANGLAGGGVVILYAAFWAAHSLFTLVGPGVALVLLVAVTAACCTLAAVHHSLLVAVLGLTGGFVTPLMVPAAVDNPLGLFAYILLLDAGLLALSRWRRWPRLALLSLLATAVHEVLFVAGRLDTAGPLAFLTALVILAALFAAAGQVRARHRRVEWLASQAASVLLPFGFALYFSAQARLDVPLLPLSALLLVLLGGAVGLGRLQRRPALPLAAATAALTVLLVWSAENPLAGGGAGWQLAGVTLALALVCQLPLRSTAESSIGSWAGTPAAVVAGFGAFAVLALAAGQQAPLSVWPWAVGWLLHAALLVRLGRRRGAAPLQLAAAAALGVVLGGLFLLRGEDPGFPPPEVFLGVLLATAVVAQGASLLGRRGEAGLAAALWAERAAALLPLLAQATLLLAGGPSAVPTGLFYSLSLAFLLLAALAGLRLASGTWYLAAGALTALAHWMGAEAYAGATPAAEAGALAWGFIAVVLLTALPLAAAPRLAAHSSPWRAAAVAGPLWFPTLHRLYVQVLGDDTVGLLPVALGAVALGAALTSRHLTRLAPQTRRTALVWLSAVSLLFAALAIPLQLHREWWTLGWALEGLALLTLWRRLDHPGLKALGLALLAAATVRLVANPQVLTYHHDASGWPVLNWLAYTYLVPAAALLGAAWTLAPLEVARLTPAERRLYPAARPVGAGACVAGAIAVVFVWINLTIFDAFKTTPVLRLDLAHVPARDLTLSFAWALYAVVLLAMGLGRGRRWLRHTGLAFLVLTILKVFLHDLGELSDLYRVASLLGLAVSLTLVSVGYQRLVLRSEREEAERQGGQETAMEGEPQQRRERPEGGAEAEEEP